MARKCDISGKHQQFGNRVSHAKNKTRHRFKCNLQTRRIYLPEEKRRVRVRISTRLLRTIDKIGFEQTLKKHGLTLKELLA